MHRSGRWCAHASLLRRARSRVLSRGPARRGRSLWLRPAPQPPGRSHEGWIEAIRSGPGTCQPRVRVRKHAGVEGIRRRASLGHRLPHRPLPPMGTAARASPARPVGRGCPIPRRSDGRSPFLWTRRHSRLEPWLPDQRCGLRLGCLRRGNFHGVRDPTGRSVRLVAQHRALPDPALPRLQIRGYRRKSGPRGGLGQYPGNLDSRRGAALGLAQPVTQLASRQSLSVLKSPRRQRGGPRIALVPPADSERLPARSRLALADRRQVRHELALRAVGREADDDDSARLEPRHHPFAEGGVDDVLPHPVADGSGLGARPLLA